MGSVPEITGRSVRAVCLALALSTSCAQAQATWPARPITLIVPGAAGSSLDNIARLYADKLGQALGQPVVVEIRAGGNGAVGARALAAAKPDGYTLMFPGNSITVLPTLTQKNPTYDPEKDFAPVAQVITIPFGIAVARENPAQSLKELIAMAKAGEVTFATPGAASISRLIGEWLNQKEGTRFTNVPYPSSAPAHTDVIGGRVAVMIDGLGGVVPHVKSGRMRLLAITSQGRMKGFEDVPAAVETVPGFVIPGFIAVVAPAGTPRDPIEILNRATRKVVQDSALNERFAVFGAEGVSGPVADLERLLNDQRALFKGLIEQAKIKPE